MASLDPYRYITAADRYYLTPAQIEEKAARQKAIDEAAAAKEKAEYGAQKTANAYNTAKASVANTAPTSYNTGQYYAAKAIQSAGQSVPTPAPANSYNNVADPYETLWGIVSNKPLIKYNTADIEAGKAYNTAMALEEEKANKAESTGSTASTSSSKPNSSASTNGYTSVADLNRPTNGSGTVPNEGLTTEDARKEHISIMNDPAINPPTDSQIGAGAPSSGGDTPSGAPDVNAPAIPTAAELANYVSTIISAAKEQLGDVDEPEYMEGVEKPGAVTLRSLDDLAKTYGIEYDYNSILNRFNNSVEKKYEAMYEKQKQNEAKYYDNAVAAQNTLLDTLTRDRGSAVQTGVSKGMQAANALGAMLGVSQKFADNATALSQERGNMAKDYGADLAQAIVDADATSNERKSALMEISKMLYGYDSEQYVANMDNYNTILTNNAALQQTYLNNQADYRTALASLFGNVASNRISGDYNILLSNIAAEAQKYAADASAAGQKDAATASAEAQKWIALLQQAGLDANEAEKIVAAATNKNSIKDTTATYEAMNSAIASGFSY